MRILFFILAFGFTLNIFAQGEDVMIRKGNKQYKNGKFTPADSLYRESLKKNPKSFKGQFNLGDALYKQGKFAEAADNFQSLTLKKSNSDTLSKVWHNLGNCQLRQKKYEDCIKSYKNSLKLNQKDEDTRYNLAYAQKMLQQQQQQQNQNKNDNKNDQKDKDKDKNKDDKKKDQQKQNEQEQKQQMSKEDMKRLLQALNSDEKDLQNKMKKKKAKSTENKIEKDW